MNMIPKITSISAENNNWVYLEIKYIQQTTIARWHRGPPSILKVRYSEGSLFGKNKRFPILKHVNLAFPIPNIHYSEIRDRYSKFLRISKPFLL